MYRMPLPETTLCTLVIMMKKMDVNWTLAEGDNAKINLTPS
jgi:hypothetical protein